MSTPKNENPNSRRALLRAAAALAACSVVPACATAGSIRRVEGPIAPSCSARFCRNFLADPSLGEGAGRCALGVRG